MIRSTAVSSQISPICHKLLCILETMLGLLTHFCAVKLPSGPVSSCPLVKWQEHSGQEWSRAVLCNVHPSDTRHVHDALPASTICAHCVMLLHVPPPRFQSNKTSVGGCVSNIGEARGEANQQSMPCRRERNQTSVCDCENPEQGQYACTGLRQGWNSNEMKQTIDKGIFLKG